MISKKKLIYWIVVSGIFFTFLAIFYNQFEFIQFVLILFLYLECVALYYFFNEIPKYINDYAEKDNARFKKKLTPNNIFLIVFILGVLLFVLLVDPLTIIFTVIHEVAHATTAVIFGAQIYNIVLKTPGVGYTHHSGLTTNLSNSLLSVSGSLSVIISGFILLIIIYRSKTINLDAFVAVFFSIWYIVIENVKYWYTSVFSGVGVALAFLSFNPQIDPLWLANFCVILYFGLATFLLLVFFSKIARYILKYFPDLIPSRFKNIIKILSNLRGKN